MPKNYLTEIKNILAELKPYKALLFGSYAYGEIHQQRFRSHRGAE